MSKIQKKWFRSNYWVALGFFSILAFAAPVIYYFYVPPKLEVMEGTYQMTHRYGGIVSGDVSAANLVAPQNGIDIRRAPLRIALIGIGIMVGHAVGAYFLRRYCIRHPWTNWSFLLVMGLVAVPLGSLFLGWSTIRMIADPSVTLTREGNEVEVSLANWGKVRASKVIDTRQNARVLVYSILPEYDTTIGVVWGDDSSLKSIPLVGDVREGRKADELAVRIGSALSLPIRRRWEDGDEAVLRNYSPAERETIRIQGIVVQALYHYSHGYPDADDTVALMRALKSGKRSADILRQLPPEAWGGSGKPVLDAYGREMRYLKAGSRTGGPALISAGQDGDFGDTDEAKRRDNIRSDAYYNYIVDWPE